MYKTDKFMENLLIIMKSDLNVYIKSIILKPNAIILNVIDSRCIFNLSKILKKFSLFNCKYLFDLTAIDYPFRKNRFELIYFFRSLSYNYKLFLKCFIADKQGLLSLSSLYSSIPWLEREVWDMFGIVFFENFDLRRILTDYGFKGHPFRKDFPLTGFVEIRYDDSKQIILTEPLELSQEFRFFDFQSPWVKKIIY